jgi:hypothetical protein
MMIKPSDAPPVQLSKVKLLQLFSSAPKAITELCYVAKSSQHSAVRVEAVKALASLVKEQTAAIKGLTGLLKHPDSAVVTEVVRGLRSSMDGGEVTKEVLVQCANRLHELTQTGVKEHHLTMLRFFSHHMQESKLDVARETLRILVIALFVRNQNAPLMKCLTLDLSAKIVLFAR